MKMFANMATLVCVQNMCSCCAMRDSSEMNGMPSKLVRLCQKSGAVNGLALERGRELLNDGHVIGVPTDTIYGLACLAQRSDAIQRLYRIKDRNADKPLAICVADVEDIGKWCDITVTCDLLRDILPGAVTVVFQRKPQLNRDLNASTELVGIRVPDHDFLRSLARLCGPLALTSANLSTHQSSSNVDQFKHLWPHLSAVFDGGSLDHCDPQRLGSTVVDLSLKGYFRVVRDGCALKQTLFILQNKYKLNQI